MDAIVGHRMERERESRLLVAHCIIRAVVVAVVVAVLVRRFIVLPVGQQLLQQMRQIAAVVAAQQLVPRFVCLLFFPSCCHSAIMATSIEFVAYKGI